MYSTEARKQFLAENLSITAISATNTYIATVNDWQGLKTFFDTHDKDAIEMALRRNVEQNEYSGESALLKEFGNLINLYKSPTNKNELSIDKISPSGTDPKAYNSTPCYY